MKTQVYYIDSKILGIIHHCQTQEEVEATFSDYLDQLALLKLVAIETFLAGKGLDEDTIKQYEDYLSGQMEQFNLELEKTIAENAAPQPNLEDSNTDTISTPNSQFAFIDNILLSKEARELADQYSQGFNRSIYEKADESLSNEEKVQLNEYLLTIDQKFSEEYEDAKQLLIEMLKVRQATQPIDSAPVAPVVQVATPIAIPPAEQVMSDSQLMSASPDQPTAPQIHLTQQTMTPSQPQSTPQPQF